MGLQAGWLRGLGGPWEAQMGHVVRGPRGLDQISGMQCGAAREGDLEMARAVSLA